MSASTVWVVEGATGEYSDRSDWKVAAYLDGAMAKEHQRLAQAAADAWEAKCAASDGSLYRGATTAESNPYDPAMRMDYTGTFYNLSEIEISTSIPVATPK